MKKIWETRYNFRKQALKKTVSIIFFSNLEKKKKAKILNPVLGMSAADVLVQLPWKQHSAQKLDKKV